MRQRCSLFVYASILPNSGFAALVWIDALMH
jgi:hypothetical protein